METVTVSNLTKFLTDCFAALRVPKAQTEITAAAILEADLIGRSGEGLFMLDSYVSDVLSGVVDSEATPKIDRESLATAWVDGRNSLGPVVANFCVKLAVQKAKQVGAAIVVAKNSNQFGPASRYAKMALDEGLVGWICTNSSPQMVPTRGKYPTVGTNVLSLGAPGIFGDYFLFDMCTSVCSPNTISMKGSREEFLPVGYAQNEAGLPETNSAIAAKTKHFLPLGSEEKRSSYKGTGLSIMIDILSGVLAGSYYGAEVGIIRNKHLKKKANIAHSFVVLDPKRFAPGFEMRLNELLNHLRNMEPINPSKPVRVPGDLSREVRRSVERNGGLRYPRNVIDKSNEVAKTLKIKPLRLVPKPVEAVLTASEELSRRLEAEKAEMSEIEESVVEETLDDSRSDVLSMFSDHLVEEDSSDWLLRADEKRRR